MADSKISALTDGSPAVAADELAVSRTAGSATRRVTAQSVADLCGTINGSFVFNSSISPSQLTANQNDWNPTGFSTATWIRVDADRFVQITGLGSGTTAHGRVVVLVNISTSDIILRDQNTSSTAANRFALPCDFYRIPPLGTCTLLYDNTTARWRPIAAPYAGMGLGWGDQFTEDEFLNGGAETGEYGQLQWSSGAGSLSTQGSAAAHPGILRLDSTATINTIGRLHLSSTANLGSIIYDDVYHMVGIVRPNVADADSNYRFGFFQDNTVSATGGTAGVYFTYDQGNNGNGNWWFRTRNASTNTNTDSGVALTATNWYVLEIVRESAGAAWCGYINGARVARHTTNLPGGTNAHNITFVVQNDAAASKTMDIDYFSLRTVNLTQRWT